jgi:hypothetical protein
MMKVRNWRPISPTADSPKSQSQHQHESLKSIAFVGKEKVPTIIQLFADGAEGI